jgi:UDP-glucose 4-epimerase
VDALLAAGHDVIGVDDYSAGKSDNLHDARQSPRFTEVAADVLELPAGFCQGVEVIFHLAAVKKTRSLGERDLAVNALGTFRMLEQARVHGCRFIHVSTGSVYGRPVGIQDENHPLDPVSFYGVSKLAGERYAMVYRHLYGLPVTVLRYCHVYGPRQDAGEHGGVVAIFTRKMLVGEPITIHGDGTQMRSFTYVGDVVRATAWAMNNSVATVGKVFNVASGVHTSIYAMAQKLAGIIGIEPVIVYDDWMPGDSREFNVSSQRLQGLGFRFETGLDDGLARTAEWFRCAS